MWNLAIDKGIHLPNVREMPLRTDNCLDRIKKTCEIPHDMTIDTAKSVQATVYNVWIDAFIFTAWYKGQY